MYSERNHITFSDFKWKLYMSCIFKMNSGVSENSGNYIHKERKKQIWAGWPEETCLMQFTFKVKIQRKMKDKYCIHKSNA